MLDSLVKIRNGLFKGFYKLILKPIFFSFDPEVVHDRMIGAGKLIGKFKLLRKFTWWQFGYKNKVLEQNLLGLKFVSPVGLAAGFDKNAELTGVLPELGFGFAELGSVTGEPCVGNPKPRLWRLKKSESIVVYYGLKNDGAEVLSAKLSKLLANRQGRAKDFVYGVSVAKTNCSATVDLEAGIDDYLKAYRLMQPVADYITINISCPNAFGGQPFTDGKRLEKLLEKLDEFYNKKCPVLVKISPDLSMDQVDEIIDVCDRFRVDGYVCTNLTKIREYDKIKDANVPEVGGLSGKLVSNKSDDLIAHVYQKTRGKKLIVGVGGVFSARDAYAKIRLGANLVQLITGMIFEGPATIADINLGLVELLKKDGFKSISEAVGKGVSKGGDKF